MTSSLIISNFKTGFETDREPFLINNDAFPVLSNAYIWRGRILKKRGTALLGRLQVNVPATAIGNYPVAINIFAFFSIAGITPNQAIAPGSLVLTAAGPILLGDSNRDGQILVTSGGGWAQNVTAVFPIPAGFTTLTIGAHSFLPGDKVFISGIQGTPTANSSILRGYFIVNAINATQIQISVDSSSFTYTSGGFVQLDAGTINYLTSALVVNLAVVSAATLAFSYYLNVPVMGLEDFYPGINPAINFPTLVAFDTKLSYQFDQILRRFYDVNFYKQTGAPFFWHGQDYQQFWSTNYQGAMFVTNGNPGFHFRAITNVTFVGNDVTITTAGNHGLTANDFVFFNEIQGILGLNGQSGQVSNVPPPAGNVFHFIANPAPTGVYSSGGIFQYLTQSTNGDGIKWYDGDPTNNLSQGWVNFAPPLSGPYDVQFNPFYLTGARIVIPFKNRLLAFGVTLQRSTGPAVFIGNQFVYCQAIGTAYYAQPVPVNQVSDPTSWFQNVAGKGGFLNAPYPQNVITVTENRDVLLTGYENKQLKVISTGDDSFPFIYQTINSELGSQSTFSGIPLDIGALYVGEYGIAMVTQESCQRIDLQIPDSIFEFTPLAHGDQRVTSIRDFRNEFVYFTYCPSNESGTDISPQKIFPNRSLVYNYRENVWSTFEENYTHYGTFRYTTNLTWGTLNQQFKTWADWNVPWNFGSSGQRYPFIIGGNQQGFVMIKGTQTTSEDFSQYVSGISGNIITSPGHCLSEDDFIEFKGITGDPTMVALNGKIEKVVNILSQDSFMIAPDTTTGTYTGGGTYIRLSNIFLQTKQFPLFWEGGRKTRIGVQRFLLDTTDKGQITVNLYTSQDSADAVNDPTLSGYLVFSNIVLSSAENNPLNQSQSEQSQIWHRLSNSFIGDTVQIGFTLSDTQMQTDGVNNANITIHAIAFDLHKGPILI